MEIDMLTVETDCILRDMKKIKGLCHEAYNKTDSTEDKVNIQIMYEGKIFEKVKLFFSSLTVGLGKSLSYLDDLEKTIFAIPRSLIDKALIAGFNRENTTIENYREFNRKRFYDLWHKMNIIKSLARLKSSKEIDMDDPDIKELLDNAKNIASLHKQWASELMTQPKTIKYSDIGVNNRNYITFRYHKELEYTKKNMLSIQKEIKDIAKKTNGDSNTMKVVRAAVTVANAINRVTISAINKDISIQKTIFRNTGNKLIKL